ENAVLADALHQALGWVAVAVDFGVDRMRKQLAGIDVLERPQRLIAVVAGLFLSRTRDRAFGFGEPLALVLRKRGVARPRIGHPSGPPPPSPDYGLAAFRFSLFDWLFHSPHEGFCPLPAPARRGAFSLNEPPRFATRFRLPPLRGRARRDGTAMLEPLN